MKNKSLLSLLIAFILGYFYVDSVVQLSTITFIVVIIGIHVWVHWLSASKSYTKQELFCICTSLLLLISIYYKNNILDYPSDNLITTVFTYFILHLVLIVFATSRFQYQIEGRVGYYSIFDICKSAFINPILYFFLPYNNVALSLQRRIHKENKSSFIITLCVTLISIPLLLFAADLLAKTDVQFGNLLANLIDLSWIDLHYNLCIALFSLPIGIYFYSLTISLYQKLPKQISMDTITTQIKKARILPNISVLIPLCAFIALYFGYLFLQANHIIEVLFTQKISIAALSTYARDGFFEMCLLLTLNLAIIFIICKFTIQPYITHKVTKILIRIFIVESILLTFTALIKLFFYMSYGMTILRLTSLWWIGILLLMLILCMLLTVKKRNFGQFFMYTSVVSYCIVLISEVVIFYM